MFDQEPVEAQEIKPEQINKGLIINRKYKMCIVDVSVSATPTTYPPPNGHFFRVYIASSKHEEGWEISRHL